MIGACSPDGDGCSTWHGASKGEAYATSTTCSRNSKTLVRPWRDRGPGWVRYGVFCCRRNYNGDVVMTGQSLQIWGGFLAIEARRSKVVPGSMYFCEAMRTDQEICRHDRRSASLYMYGKWRTSCSHRRPRLCSGNNFSADRLGRCLMSPTPQSKHASALDSRYDSLHLNS